MTEIGILNLKPIGVTITRNIYSSTLIIISGGMFEYVSGANFFGECLEWSGYALACSSISAVAFAVFTTSFVGVRAIQHHK